MALSCTATPVWRISPMCANNLSKTCYYASQLTLLRRMHGIRRLTSAAKSESAVRLFGREGGCGVQLPFSNVKHTLCTKRPYEINTDVKKDVILFRYLNPKWYRILNTFAVCQCCFWMYSAHLGYTLLKDTPVKTDVNGDLPFWRKINLGERKYRLGFTVLSILIGLSLMTTTCLYTAKSVKYLILHKGGKSITLVTHGPFGRNITRTVDLTNVSCPVSRLSAKGQLPVKVKGNYVHYVLDMRGEFMNPQLFDYTAGIKRSF